MADEVFLPSMPGPDATLDELRSAFRQLLTWATAREPLSNGGETQKFVTSQVDGGVTLSDKGHIKAGQSAWRTGAGMFLGYSAGVFRLSLGNSRAGMTWDGTTLTVIGNGVFSGSLAAATGTLGALTIASGGYIRSANYVAGASGFTIESDGRAEFASLVVRNASGNVMLNALATGAAAPPWIVGGSSVGGGVDITTGLTTDGAMQLRSMIPGPGIAIGYTSTGAVQVGVTSPLNDEVQLAADETTTTVGITPANMTLPLLANTTYVIRGRLMVSSALATTGHVLGCNVPSGAATVLRVTAQATQSTAEQRVLNLPSGSSGTVVFTDHFAATQAAPTVFDSGSFSIMEFEASVINGSTAGVFELVFGSEVPGSSVTLRAGSSMTGQALKAGVAAPVGLAGAPAYTTPVDAALYRGNSRSALATAAVSILRDGTWATSRTGGASTSGNWAATPSANVGLQWQVRFVPTAGTLSSNGAAEWTTISATFTASLTVFSPTGSGSLESSTCTVQIRFKNILTGVETTAGTVVLNAEAQSDANEYNP